MSDAREDALRAAIERPHMRGLWGKDHLVHPRLLTAIFGDGKALLILTPTNTRPAYYVVRIGSDWDLDAGSDDGVKRACVRDHLNDIQDAIEEEFGVAVDTCRDDCPEGCEDAHERPWPAADFSVGVSWGTMAWPALAVAWMARLRVLLDAYGANLNGPTDAARAAVAGYTLAEGVRAILAAYTPAPGWTRAGTPEDPAWIRRLPGDVVLYVDPEGGRWNWEITREREVNGDIEVDHEYAHGDSASRLRACRAADGWWEAHGGTGE